DYGDRWTRDAECAADYDPKDEPTPPPWLFMGKSITAAKPGRPPGSHERTTIAQRVNRAGDGWLIESAHELRDGLTDCRAFLVHLHKQLGPHNCTTGCPDVGKRIDTANVALNHARGEG